MQKGFAPILIVLLLAIISVGGLLMYWNQTKSTNTIQQITQTPAPTFTTTAIQTASSSTSLSDETANWKTYIDDKYGFTFRYPSFLLVSVNELNYEAPSIKQIGFYNPNNKEKFDPDAINMNILRYDINRAKENEDLKNGFSEDVAGNKLKRNVIEKEIIVGGRKGNEFTINFLDNETQEPVFLEYEFLIPLNSKTLSIHLYSANNKAKKIVDDIVLPTFKFLE